MQMLIFQSLQIALTKKTQSPYIEWSFTKNCQELSDYFYIFLHIFRFTILHFYKHFVIYLSSTLSTILYALGTARNTTMPQTQHKKIMNMSSFPDEKLIVHLGPLQVVGFVFWSLADTQQSKRK